MKKGKNDKADSILIPRYSDEVLLMFKKKILIKREEEQAFLDDEEDPLIRAHISRFIEKLSESLLRIEDKSYGRCCMTGKLIPRERLEKALCATTSMEGKPIQKAKENQQDAEKRAKIASMVKTGREKLEPVLLSTFNI